MGLKKNAFDLRFSDQAADQICRSGFIQPPGAGGRRVGAVVMSAIPYAYPFLLTTRRLVGPVAWRDGRSGSPWRSGEAFPPAVLVEQRKIDLAAIAMAQVRRHGFDP